MLVVARVALPNIWSLVQNHHFVTFPALTLTEDKIYVTDVFESLVISDTLFSVADLDYTFAFCGVPDFTIVGPCIFCSLTAMTFV